jgi:hypothetical protein
VGIYSSAISVSQDATLRRSIQNSLENQSKLLHGIGTAQMDQEIQTVLKIANKQADKMKDETEIEATSSQEDMKEYWLEVIKEIEKASKSISIIYIETDIFG